MNKLERVAAAIEGRQVDRPPVSFWHHFDPRNVVGQPAVDAHVRHVETYDLDFLKIMDDNRYPRTATSTGVIAGVEDLDKLTVLRGDEHTFGRQLELIGGLAKRVAGELLTSTTIFNTWSTLCQMTAPDPGVHGPPTPGKPADHRIATMSSFLREAPEALARALDVIGESLANFARHCIAAGADGVFLSVRDDSVDTPENGVGTYERFVRPGDKKILAGAQCGTLNMLHVCGKAVDFDRFCDYPVHAINWADRYAGPTIAEVSGKLKPTICAGLDNLGTMVGGSPEECAQQAGDALEQAAGHPIMIAPGCTYDPDIVPQANLQAILQATRRLSSQTAE